MGPLVMLGLFSVAGYVLIVLVVVALFGGSMMMGMMMEGAGTNLPPEAAGGLVAGVGLVTVLLVLLIGTVVAMALFYAIPLVMLAGQNAWPAVQASLLGCWINMLPLLVFGLIYIVLAAVAMLPLGLGFLILGPVTACAAYISYRDVFADTADTVVGVRLDK